MREISFSSPSRARAHMRGREEIKGRELHSLTRARTREREREKMGREGERFSLPLASPRDGKFCRERERNERKEGREERG